MDKDTGAQIYAPHATDKSAQYKSYTHGVFQRSAHIQEVLLRETNITWRALGGNIDLYFYQGPTQDSVTKSYQKSAVNLVRKLRSLLPHSSNSSKWSNAIFRS